MLPALRQGFLKVAVVYIKAYIHPDFSAELGEKG